MDIREKLLDAAARLYAETGFRGTTTRRIAQEAGVNEITLFRHFGSKAALLHEAIARPLGSVHEALLPDVPVAPERELLDWARHYAVDMRGRRRLIRTCMAECEEFPEMRPPEGSGPVQAREVLCRYLERLREQGRARTDFDPGVAAAMLMGALFADAMGRDVMPEMFTTDADASLAQYVHLFLRAIGAAS
jgi:AcrR family transcriptional regulator